MASAFLKEFTEDNFQTDVLHNGSAVVVDFWAPWCGPCRMVGPIIEELAEEYEGKVVVGKVNVDDNPKLAEQYKVMTIPTVAVFKGGELVDKVIGARTKDDFAAMIESAK